MNKSAEEILKKHIGDLVFKKWEEQKPMTISAVTMAMMEYASQSTSVSTKANGEAEDVEALAFKIYPIDETMKVKGNHFRREAFIAGYKAAQSTPKPDDFVPGVREEEQP